MRSIGGGGARVHDFAERKAQCRGPSSKIERPPPATAFRRSPSPAARGGSTDGYSADSSASAVADSAPSRPKTRPIQQQARARRVRGLGEAGASRRSSRGCGARRRVWRARRAAPAFRAPGRWRRAWRRARPSSARPYRRRVDRRAWVAERAPVDVLGKVPVLGMGGDELQAPRHGALGERNLERGRRAQRRGDAGDDLDRNAGRLAPRDLLRRAAEDHRVAALETDHDLALPREGHHHRGDVVLLAGGAVAALADVDLVGLAPCHVDDRGGRRGCRRARCRRPAARAASSTSRDRDRPARPRRG